MQAGDVLVLTERGNAELLGGGTSLPSEQLQALILVDGRSSVAQIVAGVQSLMQGAGTALASEAIARLLEQRYVAPAKPSSPDSIDPDETLNPKGAAAVAGGVAGFSPLTAHGFHAAIARRAAEKRKRSEERRVGKRVGDGGRRRRQKKTR